MLHPCLHRTGVPLRAGLAELARSVQVLGGEDWVATVVPRESGKK